MLRRVLASCSFATLSSLNLLAAFLFVASAGTAQINGGTPSWGAYDRGQYDTINLQNLSISLNIPIMSKAGAFPFTFGLTGGGSYVSASIATLQPGINGESLVGVANGTMGAYSGSGASYGGGSTFAAYENYTEGAFCPNGDTTYKYSNWFIQTPDGTTHYLPTADYTLGSPCATSFTDQVIDGTGYTLSVSANSTTAMYDASGMQIGADEGLKLIDTHNNTVTWTPDTGFTDTLGLEVLTCSPSTTCLASAEGSITFGWTDVSGSPSVTESYTSTTLKSVFGCSGYSDYTLSNSYLPKTLSFPDGTSMAFSWEATPGYSSDSTGRLSTLTLRSGSTVSYNYNPSNATHDGLNCTYLVPNKLTRTTSDGTATYSWASANNGTGSTTTKVDLGGNKTIYTFTGLTSTGNAPLPAIQALTEIQYYVNTGTVTNPTYSSTPTRQDVYCYGTVTNGQPSNCPAAVVDVPVLEQNIYSTLGNMATSSQTQMKFDKYGNVTYSAQYDFGASSPTLATTTTYGSWNGSACVAISSTINNKPCQVVTAQNGENVAYSRFTYSSTGNLLRTYVSPNGGSSFLSNTTSNVYNGNGTPSTTYDLGNFPTSYSYSSASYTSCGSCTNYPFPTSISKGGLTTSYTWNGVGGVKLSATDANGKITSYGYQSSGGAADPWWRLRSVTDPLTNEMWINPTVTSNNTSFEFNSSHSIKNVTTTFDGYGRQIDVQVQQSPTSGSYDTVSISYNFSAVNPTMFKSVPCTTTSLGAQCPSGPGVTNSYDMFGRQVSSVDGGGGATTTSYSENDVASTLGPPPAGENNKQVQNQYDGLGRLLLSCAIGSVNGSAACGQNTGSSSGVTTSYSYSQNDVGQTGVSLTRGAQTRSKTYDSLGRVVGDTSPEGGNVTYVYDSATSCGATLSYPGHLMYTAFANGNTDCYQYDSLGRVVAITGVNSSGATLCRRFYYDNSTGVFGAIPSGVTAPTNPYGRMVEAETDNCTWPVTTSTMITDEWFSYDADGNIADMWELTPHSGTYYHSHATFAGNGAPLTVQLENPALYTETYGLDGEGRPSTLMSGSLPIVSSTTYNAASQPTYIDLGTGTDQSDYVYDSNTNRMTNWIFQVGSTESETGTLTWNANATLRELVIDDGFNSAGSQTCTFGTGTVMGYDDLGRLLSDNCGSAWSQTFSYDQYDNITKSGSISWNPGYNAANNQYSTGATYDSSGNLTWDTIHTYTWDQFNKLSSIDTTNCATGGECVTYDAFGHIVESSYKGTYTEIWYTQVGKTAYMVNGNSIYYAYWPTPGSGTVEVNGNNATAYYMHKDWLGSSRISSVIVNPAVVSDQAYAPYSEVYDKVNTGAAVPAQMFTGDTQDIVSGIFDTPNRELNSSQGRWLSPDPAGVGWNRYAYATNPNSEVDPSGLGGPYLNVPPTSSTLSGDVFDLMNIPVTSGDSQFGPIADLTVYGPAFYADSYTASFDDDGSTVFSLDSSVGDLPVVSTLTIQGWYNPVIGTGLNFSTAANNGLDPNSTLGWTWNFTKSFFSGVVNGVRQPGQSVGECMNQNVTNMTFGTVDPQKLFNQGLNVAEGTAALLTATNLRTAVGPSVPLGPYVAGQLARMAGLGSTGTAVAIRAAAAGGTTLAVAGAATAGTAIGSAINCR